MTIRKCKYCNWAKDITNKPFGTTWDIYCDKKSIVTFGESNACKLFESKIPHLCVNCAHSRCSNFGRVKKIDCVFREEKVSAFTDTCEKYKESEGGWHYRIDSEMEIK